MATLVGAPDPSRVLVTSYPVLHALLKSGGWSIQQGRMEIDEALWASLSPALRQDIDSWLEDCGLRSARSDTRRTDLLAVIQAMPASALDQIPPTLKAALLAWLQAGGGR